MDKHTFTLYFPHTNDVFLLSGMNAVFMEEAHGYYSELPTKQSGHNKQVSRFDKIPFCLLLHQ